MRTDTIFYKLFLTFPNLIFELLEIPAQSGYQFSSREIKELARRFDGIFMPSDNNTEQPIYFIEVQFQDKQDFWWRFITEIFNYLGQYQPENDWCAVALFANSNLAVEFPHQYRGLMLSEQIKIIYLDQLDSSDNLSLGLEVISLIVGNEQQAITTVPKIIQETRQQITNAENQAKILELVETVLVYKLKNITREEIEAMFTLDELKETRYFQDVQQDAKLEVVPLLIELGMTIEEIATKLNLDLDKVRKAAANN